MKTRRPRREGYPHGHYTPPRRSTDLRRDRGTRPARRWRRRGRGRGRHAWPVDLRRTRPARRFQAFRLRQSGRAEGRLADHPDQEHQRQPELRYFRYVQHLRLQGRWRGRHGRDLRHADVRDGRRALDDVWSCGEVGARIGRQADLSLRFAARGAFPRRFAPDREGRRLFPEYPEGEGAPDLPRHSRGFHGRRGRWRRRLRCQVFARPQPRRASDHRGHADLFVDLVRHARIRRHDAGAAARVGPLQGGALRAGPLRGIRARARLLGREPAGERRPEQFRSRAL